MADVLLDALLDTLKLFPWLLLIYIIIELIEHKTNLTGPNNRLSGKLGPLIGSATGLIPQCGFSVMAAKLFEQKYITVGTLLAIFLSTSDEAFIILLSSGKGAVWLLPLIAVKIVVGVAVGYAADGILKGFGRRQTRVESSRGKYLDEARSHAHSEHAHHSHGAVSSPSEGAQGAGGSLPEDCHGAVSSSSEVSHSTVSSPSEDSQGAGTSLHEDSRDTPSHELFLKKAQEKEFECTSCGRVHDESTPFTLYFLSPLLHALKVALFILIVNVVLGVVIYYVTEERFISFMNKNLFVQPFISSLVGLIPNCASSVVITGSFLQGGISFGSCAAGLCANAGLGFVVLLKNVKEWRRNLVLIAICYVVAVAVGLALNALSLLF